ncbi:MAG: hypothetical protein VKO64_13145 [Candidatus Sericytochromatia bacterium]|nr:hypothetical protein [Candidatus Sericytochromatia bacterium]
MRGGTGPLDGQRRPTGTFVNPDEAPGMLAGHQRQVRACRIALDGLSGRMVLLEWALKKSEPVPPAPAAPAEPPPPAAGKKPLLGLGKGAGRPAPGTRPPARTPPGREKGAAPGGLDLPAAVRSPEHLRRAEAMAVAIGNNPDLRRRAQIALQQYRLACETVGTAEQHLAGCSDLDAVSLAAELGGFSLGKVQGTLVPLVNLAEAFRDAPVLKANFDLA